MYYSKSSPWKHQPRNPADWKTADPTPKKVASVYTENTRPKGYYGRHIGGGDMWKPKVVMPKDFVGPMQPTKLASGGYYSHSPYDEYPHEDFHVIEPWMGYGSDQAYPIGSTGSDWDFNYNDRRRDYEDRVFGPLYIG